MALQIALLETSFQTIAPRGEAFVTAFYERLFTRFPETRAFFATHAAFSRGGNQTRYIHRSAG
jgi:hemoglobin-like flavoprotein